MTKEEAIKALGLMEHVESIVATYEPGEARENTTVRELKEACRMAISVLNAQQAFVKLNRSRCTFCAREIYIKTTQYLRSALAPATYVEGLRDRLIDLTGEIYMETPKKYCHICGRPLTEEAWAELERRIGGNDGTTF